MSEHQKELIEAGEELYRLVETIGTMASEYVRWSERTKALERWKKAKEVISE